jgi:hypothetical protein
VVIAANVAVADPGPVAITSPVNAVIAVVDAAAIAAVVKLVTRPFASTDKTGTTLEEPMLLCAVVIAASVGTG